MLRESGRLGWLHWCRITERAGSSRGVSNDASESAIAADSVDESRALALAWPGLGLGLGLRLRLGRSGSGRETALRRNAHLGAAERMLCMGSVQRAAIAAFEASEGEIALPAAQVGEVAFGLRAQRFHHVFHDGAKLVDLAQVVSVHLV